MRGIILAAGYGSRMYPLAQDIPKCLLIVHGETLLERQIRILRECGIDDILVVTGFKGEAIKENYEGQINIIYNPHYTDTGNIYSLWLARNFLQEDTIISNADIVFTKEPIKDLIEDKNNFCMLADIGKVPLDNHKLRVEDNRILEINRDLPNEKAQGEFLGIAKVSKEGLDLFKLSLIHMTQQDPTGWWIFSLTNLLSKGIEINFIDVVTPWAEMDTKEAYEEIKRRFG